MKCATHQALLLGWALREESGGLRQDDDVIGAELDGDGADGIARRLLGRDRRQKQGVLARIGRLIVRVKRVRWLSGHRARSRRAAIEEGRGGLAVDTQVDHRRPHAPIELGQEVRVRPDVAAIAVRRVVLESVLAEGQRVAQRDVGLVAGGNRQGCQSEQRGECGQGRDDGAWHARGPP